MVEAGGSGNLKKKGPYPAWESALKDWCLTDSKESVRDGKPRGFQESRVINSVEDNQGNQKSGPCRERFCLIDEATPEARTGCVTRQRHPVKGTWFGNDVGNVPGHIHRRDIVCDKVVLEVCQDARKLKWNSRRSRGGRMRRRRIGEAEITGD